MGWAVGYDEKWKRDIGYGVPAYCDHPGCYKKIDRGLSYVCCETQPYGGENGCGLYFCGRHKRSYKAEDAEGEVGPLCSRCAEEAGPFDPKPDHPEWIDHKLTHESWESWRQENPDSVARMRRELGDEPIANSP